MSKNKTIKHKPNQNQREYQTKIAFSTKNKVIKAVVFVTIAALILSVAVAFFATAPATVI